MVLFSALTEELTTLQNLARDSSSRHAADLVELSVKVDRRFDEKDEALETLHQQITQEIASALERLESTAAEFLNIRAVLRQVRDEAGQQLAAGSPARGSRDNDGTVGDPAWEGLDAWLGDQDYRAFQASFRGDPQEIADRMRVHLALFAGVKGPIADLGCGRGEFLDLLAEAGHRAIGVETNAADVEECLERGHEAVVADLFDWLEQREPGSLGAVFLAQVIEHLAPPQWQRLVDLAATRLEPGGCLVVETINPESIYAMLRAYVADPTHVRPVHPDLLEFLARRAGFFPVQVELQAPVPKDERPADLPVDAFADDPPLLRLAGAVQEVLTRVDRLCFAPQEYTLWAKRPDGSSGDMA
jgi:O-antigen chain-terminating methyltransferase